MTHQHKDRLLKEYTFNESPVGVAQNIPFPSSTATYNVISAITLEHINSDDRVNLAASIQWTVTLTGIANAAGPLFQIQAFQQATFQIWRDRIGSNGVVVCQFTDTGPFVAVGSAAAAGPVTVVAPNTFTSDITCTDYGVSQGTHTYYLTVTVPANASIAVGGLLITNVSARVIGQTVTGWSFEGFVIDEN